jgi:hypothetical protein
MAQAPAVTEEQPVQILVRVQARKAYAHERAIKRIAAEAVNLSPKYRQMVGDALRVALDEVSA